jgi:hypothetical protein
MRSAGVIAISVVEDMGQRRTGSINAGAAVDEDGLGQCVPGLEDRRQLLFVEWRIAVVGDGNVADGETGCSVNAQQIRIGVEAKVFLREETNDGTNTERLCRLDPALDVTHTDGPFAATGVSGARGTVESIGNDGTHRARRAGS